MAGFIQRFVQSSFMGGKGAIKDNIKDVITLGLKYDDMVMKNSRAIGVAQAEFGKYAIGDENLMRSLELSDIGTKKNIAYFDKDFKARRDYLRKFALNGEIEFIIDTISDEAIVYDEGNFFLNTSNASVDIELKEEISTAIEDNFKKIYQYFHFTEDTTAWDYFRQFLIDGFLAFEIIYDDKAKNIIGFKELAPESLRPDTEINEEGTLIKIWHQYEENPQMYRKLKDSSIIYISYGKSPELSRTSYIERLVRSFNLLRILENSRIIWNLMNSTYRLKMVVPIGSKSPQRAKESLAELMSIYKEDIDLNFESGELFINGRPGMQFYKNYMMPSKGGEQVEIETINGEGPDLSDTEALSYFENKLKKDSKIPTSRFDSSAGGGTLTMGADGIDRDEIRFNKFITRLRSKFQEVLYKPLYIQMILQYPALQGDELFKSQIGFKWNEDNVFQEIKQMEIDQKRLDHIESLRNLMDADGTTPFFDMRYLIETHLFMSKEELDKNDKYKRESKKKADAALSGTDDAGATDSTDGAGGDESGEKGTEGKPGKDDPNDAESAAGTDNFGF